MDGFANIVGRPFRSSGDNNAAVLCRWEPLTRDGNKRREEDGDASLNTYSAKEGSRDDLYMQKKQIKKCQYFLTSS